MTCRLELLTAFMTGTSAMPACVRVFLASLDHSSQYSVPKCLVLLLQALSLTGPARGVRQMESEEGRSPKSHWTCVWLLHHRIDVHPLNQLVRAV
jgi:hypothetical protein